MMMITKMQTFASLVMRHQHRLQRTAFDHHRLNSVCLYNTNRPLVQSTNEFTARLTCSFTELMANNSNTETALQISKLNTKYKCFTFLLNLN